MPSLDISTNGKACYICQQKIPSSYIKIDEPFLSNFRAHLISVHKFPEGFTKHQTNHFQNLILIFRRKWSLYNKLMIFKWYCHFRGNNSAISEPCQNGYLPKILENPPSYVRNSLLFSSFIHYYQLTPSVIYEARQVSFNDLVDDSHPDSDEAQMDDDDDNDSMFSESIPDLD